MDTPVQVNFENEIKMLGQVKRAVLTVAQANPSPTVQQQARLAVDQLDLAYLCLNGILGAVDFMRAEAAVQVDAALAKGDVKIGPEV
jgi:hypothetical protein